MALESGLCLISRACHDSMKWLKIAPKTRWEMCPFSVPLWWCTEDSSHFLQKLQSDDFLSLFKRNMSSRGYILNLTGLEGDFSGKNLPSFSLSSVCGTGLRKTRAGAHSVPRNSSSIACSWALVWGKRVWDKHPKLLWEEKVRATKKEMCGVTIRASGTPMELLSWHFILSCCSIKHHRLKHLDGLIQLPCVLLKCLLFSPSRSVRYNITCFARETDCEETLTALYLKAPNTLQLGAEALPLQATLCCRKHPAGKPGFSPGAWQDSSQQMLGSFPHTGEKIWPGVWRCVLAMPFPLHCWQDNSQVTHLWCVPASLLM